MLFSAGNVIGMGLVINLNRKLGLSMNLRELNFTSLALPLHSPEWIIYKIILCKGTLCYV